MKDTDYCAGVHSIRFLAARYCDSAWLEHAKIGQVRCERAFCNVSGWHFVDGAWGIEFAKFLSSQATGHVHLLAFIFNEAFAIFVWPSWKNNQVSQTIYDRSWSTPCVLQGEEPGSSYFLKLFSYDLWIMKYLSLDYVHVGCCFFSSYSYTYLDIKRLSKSGSNRRQVHCMQISTIYYTKVIYFSSTTILSLVMDADYRRQKLSCDGWHPFRLCWAFWHLLPISPQGVQYTE